MYLLSISSIHAGTDLYFLNIQIYITEANLFLSPQYNKNYIACLHILQLKSFHLYTGHPLVFPIHLTM